MPTRRSIRIAKMKLSPNYCETDSDEGTEHDDSSNYSDSIPYFDEETKDENDNNVNYGRPRPSTPIPSQTRPSTHILSKPRPFTPIPFQPRNNISICSRLDFSELATHELCIGQTTIYHKLFDGLIQINDKIITILAIFAMAKYGNRGSLEYFYNTICENKQMALHNIQVTFKDKCHPKRFIDDIHVRWLTKCFVSSATTKKHATKKMIYEEKMKNMNIEATLNQLFIKQDETKLANFARICNNLYNDYM